MSIAQELIDRRRLRRKLSLWRLLAVLFLALAAALLLLPAAGGSATVGGFLSRAAGGGLGAQTIARVDVEGLITEDHDLLSLLDALGNEAGVQAVILRVDSPGGTTVGGESLFDAVRRLAARKPVAAEVGTLAASAGYLVAAGADHIVARQTSIVGSIGTIFQYVDATQLLSNVGVSVNAIKSSPLKAEPSPFSPTPEAAREMIARLIADSYEWFVATLVARRPIPPADLRALADGSVFTGRQALANRLIDALGGEREARAWLENERGVPKGLEIVDRAPKNTEGFSLFARGRAAMLGALGLDTAGLAAGDLARTGGLMALWQPALAPAR